MRHKKAHITPVKNELKFLYLKAYSSIIPSISLLIPIITPLNKFVLVSYPVKGKFQSGFTMGSLAVNWFMALNRISRPGENTTSEEFVELVNEIKSDAASKTYYQVMFAGLIIAAAATRASLSAQLFRVLQPVC